ncbi:MAG: DUF4280 domain-containing protein [Polyangiaceae bacterium]
MPKLVVHGAKLKCSAGTSPASLSILPANGTDGDEQPAATVNDFVPMTNIAAFGMCTTQANPQVAAATSAAQGVLTPQPCMPVVTAPWSPGSSHTTIREQTALTADSKCQCAWSGSIEITDPASGIDIDP